MDCNSYSYTPHMLDEDQHYIACFNNDDMEIELERHNTYFSVWAYSYDGQLDVYETFNNENAARTLYNHIMDNCTDAAPNKRELYKTIRNAHKEDIRQ